MTRRELHGSTALRGSGWMLGQGDAAEGFAVDFAASSQARSETSTRFEESCLCSDGEIYLRGDDLLARLLSRR